MKKFIPALVLATSLVVAAEPPAPKEPETVVLTMEQARKLAGEIETIIRQRDEAIQRAKAYEEVARREASKKCI